MSMDKKLRPELSVIIGGLFSKKHWKSTPHTFSGNAKKCDKCEYPVTDRLHQPRSSADGPRIQRMLEQYLQAQVEAGADPKDVKRALLNAQKYFIINHPDA